MKSRRRSANQRSESSARDEANETWTDVCGHTNTNTNHEKSHTCLESALLDTYDMMSEPRAAAVTLREWGEGVVLLLFWRACIGLCVFVMMAGSKILREKRFDGFLLSRGCSQRVGVPCNHVATEPIAERPQNAPHLWFLWRWSPRH